MSQQSYNRNLYLDTIKGFAVLSMLLTNSHKILAMSPLINLNHDLAVSIYDKFCWLITFLFADGIARAVFSLSLGAGLILLYNSKSNNGAAIFFRLVSIAYLGLINTYVLQSHIDILVFHAIFSGIALIAYISLKNRIWIFLFLVLFGHGYYLGVNYRVLTGPMIDNHYFQEKIKEIGYEKKNVILPETIGIESDFYYFYKKIAKANNRFAKVFQLNSRLSFDILSHIILGMLLLQNGFLLGKLSLHKYLKISIICLVFGYSIRVFFAIKFLQFSFRLSDFIHYFLVYEIARTAIALGAISLIYTFLKTKILSDFFQCIAYVGKASLSNYMLQSLILTSFFYSYGYYVNFQFSRLSIVCITLLIWLINVIFSILWLRNFQHGPLEFLVRRKLYRQ